MDEKNKSCSVCKTNFGVCFGIGLIVGSAIGALGTFLWKKRKCSRNSKLDKFVEIKFNKKVDTHKKLIESFSDFLEKIDYEKKGVIASKKFKETLEATNLSRSSVDCIMNLIKTEKIGENCEIKNDIINIKDTCERLIFEDHKMESAVFLGGVCGRSTWRNETAIPMLEKNNIKHFNPQVNEWVEDLVLLENLMKAACPCLLFVFNSETRSILSMMEVVQYICEGRNVVLVVNKFKGQNDIPEEDLTKKHIISEIRDISRSRYYLESIANLYGTPVFDNVEDACLYIIKLYGTVPK